MAYEQLFLFVEGKVVESSLQLSSKDNNGDVIVVLLLLNRKTPRFLTAEGTRGSLLLVFCPCPDVWNS